MELLARYDKWFEDCVRAVLLWLEEWLDLSQRTVERGMIVAYLLLAFMPVHQRDLTYAVAGTAVVSIIMYNLHRRPVALRGLRFKETRAVRVAFMVPIFGTTIALELIPFAGTKCEIGKAIAQMVYVVFFYVTDIGNHGERGRRRKLALAKLKELFGDLTWLPKPVGVEG